MVPFDVTTCLVFFLTFLVCWYLTRRPKNLPPGPTPWPVVGNLPMFFKKPTDFHVVMAELHKQYGDMVTLWLGPFPHVIINSYEKIQEVLILRSDIFSDRPVWMFLLQQYSQNIGIALSQGPRWQAVRRMTLRAIRDLGVGKRTIEEKIQEEAEFMCQEVAKHVGKPFSCRDLFQRAVNNIICSVCFGQRFEYGDKTLQEIIDKMTEFFVDNAFLNPVNFYPVLRFVPFDLFRLKQMEKRYNSLHDFLSKMIDKHRESFDPQQIRHFVDLCILKEHEGHGEDHIFSRLSMRTTLLDLFSAGTETTSTSLRWLVLYMLHRPDIQDKCQAEVDRVVGPSRVASLADRTSMPYVDATIHEILRHSNIAPTTLPHNAKTDSTIGGYHIPKNTVILAHLAAVHMDERYWEEPKLFKPERWIGPDGNLMKKKAYMPFSVGPRVCPGESLARNELFIFFSMLLQRFTFKPVDPENLPSKDGIMGVTHSPKEFEIIPETR